MEGIFPMLSYLIATKAITKKEAKHFLDNFSIKMKEQQ